MAAGESLGAGGAGVFALSFSKCSHLPVSTKILRSIRHHDTLHTGFLLGHPDITSKPDFLIKASASTSLNLTDLYDVPIALTFGNMKNMEIRAVKYICCQMDDPAPAPQTIPPAPKSAFDVMMAVRRRFPTPKMSR